MAARNVQATRKDNGGDITYLCNFNEFWSPRHKNDLILDIESNIYSSLVKQLTFMYSMAQAGNILEQILTKQKGIIWMNFQIANDF